MASHIEFGKRGEELAVQHLVDKGYQIRERNWRFGKLEIDIIATMGDTLVLVEVKTRRSSSFGEPYEAVRKAKRANMVQAANVYVEQHTMDMDIRLDIISIVIYRGEEQIEHIEGAFGANW